VPVAAKEIVKFVYLREEKRSETQYIVRNTIFVCVLNHGQKILIVMSAETGLAGKNFIHSTWKRIYSVLEDI
jgi:hypothetical protein